MTAETLSTGVRRIDEHVAVLDIRGEITGASEDALGEAYAEGAGGATRYAGARINRVEDARLLTGRGTYVDDIALPGMLHACFVRSPFPRAALRGIDAAAALALPGVRFVFTAADLNPDAVEQWHSMSGPGGPETPRPPLAEGEVRFVGDPVALVIADNRYLAEDAAELVEVDYDPLPAVVDFVTAADNPALEVFPPGTDGEGGDDPEGPFLHFQLLPRLGMPIGELWDLDGLADACVADGVYEFMLTSAPMRLRNGVATPPHALAIR